MQQLHCWTLIKFLAAYAMCQKGGKTSKSRETIVPCSLGASPFTSIQTGIRKTIPRGMNAQNTEKGLNVRGRSVFPTARYVFRTRLIIHDLLSTIWFMT